MRLDPPDARRRFAEARVAHLATVRPDATPHVVPICFAVVGDTIISAVDDKPKSSNALQRLVNVAANEQVAVLVDHFDEDWSRLWWARADGRARVVEADASAVDALRAKYPQYATHSLDPVVVVEVRSWTGWAAGTSPAPEK